MRVFSKDEEVFGHYVTLQNVNFKRNWYACVTVDVDIPPIISLKNNGIISIDFNYGFLALSDVDRYGNLVNSFQVPYKFQKEKTRSEADVLETSKNVKWFCLLNLSNDVTKQMRNGWD